MGFFAGFGWIEPYLENKKASILESSSRSIDWYRCPHWRVRLSESFHVLQNFFSFFGIFWGFLGFLRGWKWTLILKWCWLDRARRDLLGEKLIWVGECTGPNPFKKYSNPDLRYLTFSIQLFKWVQLKSFQFNFSTGFRSLWCFWFQIEFWKSSAPNLP